MLRGTLWLGPAPRRSMILDVIIPDGVYAGELLSIDVGNGRILEVCVPDGCVSGDLMAVAVDEGDEQEREARSPSELVTPTPPAHPSHPFSPQPCADRPPSVGSCADARV